MIFSINEPGCKDDVHHVPAHADSTEWMALVSVIFGAVLTTIKSDQQMLLHWNISWPVWAASLIAGLAWAFGMSMDFPESRKRYSRLTG